MFVTVTLAHSLLQVKDLKSCLLQRDNEIAILVNMVKKGKKGAGVEVEEQEQLERHRYQEAEEEQQSMKRAAEEQNRQTRPQQKAGRGTTYLPVL